MRVWLLVILLFLTCFSVLAQNPDSLPSPVERPHAVYFSSNKSLIPEADSSILIARRTLIKITRDSLREKPEIYITGTLKQFNTLIGVLFPDWGAAAAIPTKNMIILKSPDNFRVGRPLRELISHEYSHLALAHRTGMFEVPRWFDEGLAMYVSMEWSWSNNLSMSKAAVFRQFIELSEIERMNRFGEGKAQVAYAQSYLAFKYFHDQYGIEGINLFLDQIRRGKSVDSAIFAATGSNLEGFEKEYREYLEKHYNITSLLMDTSYFWVSLALLVAIGAFIKYRQRRKYYKKWKEEERFESTDFDYGDENHPEKPDEDDDEAWRH